MQHQKQFIRQTAAASTTKVINMNNKLNVKNCLSLLVSLLAILLLSPTAAGAERMRLIIDTDAMAEIDDQAAITYALFSGNHFEVEGITVNRGSDGPHRTDRDQDIDDHFNEAVTVARLCASSNVPVLKGPAGNYRSVKDHVHNPTFDGSDAVNFIIQRAHASSSRKLNIFACGNVTNIALALLKDPTIANRIVVWWMGTWHPADFADNNMAGDLDAAAALFADPQNVPLHIIPWNIPEMGTTWDEYRTKMQGRGPNISPAVSTRYGSYTRVGDYLAELFNRNVGANQKENGRSILDVVGLSVVKNNVGQFTPDETGAPSINYQSDTGSERHGAIPLTWSNNPGNPRRVTFWRNPNRDAVYNDFYNTMDNYVLAGSTSPEGTLGLADGSGTREQADSVDATRFVAGSSFLADTLHARFTANTASGVMRMAIYADNDGAPGAVLGDTAEFDAGPGLRSAELKDAVEITEGNVYWIATWVQRDSTTNVTFVANDGAGTRYRAEPAYSATTGFPGGSTLSYSADVTYAVFATGTED